MEIFNAYFSDLSIDVFLKKTSKTGRCKFLFFTIDGRTIECSRCKLIEEDFSIDCSLLGTQMHADKVICRVGRNWTSGIEVEGIYLSDRNTGQRYDLLEQERIP